MRSATTEGKLRALRSGQGVRSGSLYLALALGVTGVLTYAFQSLSAHALGVRGFGLLANLWSATFLFGQVLWIGITQMLGRYIAEREARGQDWEQVVASARRLQLALLGLFILAALALSPLLTSVLFGGRVALTAAFILSICAYSFNYFRRGVLSGHRQFIRLSSMFITESGSRVIVAAILLVAGLGVVGPAVAIVLAPVISVLLIRPAEVRRPTGSGESFSLSHAFRFAMPVLASMACAQVLANGGPIAVTALGGERSHEWAGILLAALQLTRAPQYVMSPVTSNLLPHLTRVAASGNSRRFNGLAVAAWGVLALVGAALVLGVWLLGGVLIRVLFGPGFRTGGEILLALAILAAFYMQCELFNQVLFARQRGMLAALGWLAGLAAAGVVVALFPADVLHRVAYGLAAGSVATLLTQVGLHLVTLRSGLVRRVEESAT